MATKDLEEVRSTFQSTHKTKRISPYEYWAKVDNVIDGDTVDFSISLGFDLEIRVRVRLLGVDTPEIHSVSHDTDEYRAGQQAFTFVKSVLPVGRWVELKVYSGPREKFGRWLGEVYVEGRNLNADLRERGYVLKLAKGQGDVGSPTA